jgi:hypothetical protein
MKGSGSYDRFFGYGWNCWWSWRGWRWGREFTIKAFRFLRCFCIVKIITFFTSITKLNMEGPAFIGPAQSLHLRVALHKAIVFRRDILFNPGRWRWGWRWRGGHLNLHYRRWGWRGLFFGLLSPYHTRGKQNCCERQDRFLHNWFCIEMLQDDLFHNLF